MEPEGSLPCFEEPTTGPYLIQMHPVHIVPSYFPKKILSTRTTLLLSKEEDVDGH
jgi:hypothetical protein